VCAATTVPVIADAEDGLGDPVATCLALERAGAAAVQLQDVLETGEVLPTEAMCKTVRAVRRATALVVVARTDVLAADQADGLARMGAYREAGAELVMAGLSPVADQVYLGSPLLLALAEAAGRALVVFTPDGRRLLPLHALPDGVRIVLLTAAVVDRATAVIDETLHHLLDLAGAERS
jgi:2-methylisocitrate lyase-like PEP mutase family enzyme